MIVYGSHSKCGPFFLCRIHNRWLREGELLGFKLQTKTAGDSVGKGEIRDDRAKVMNGLVFKACQPKFLNIFSFNPRGLLRQFRGVIQHRIIRIRLRHRMRVLDQSIHPVFRSVLFPTRLTKVSPQTAAVVLQSVMTPVNFGDNNGHHFTLDERQWPRTPHQLRIKGMVLFHDRGINSMDLDDVVCIFDLLIRRNLIAGQITYPSHFRISQFV